MKKLLEARRTGLNGQPRPESLSTLGRLAFALGQRRAEKLAKQEAVFSAQHDGVFEMAKLQAKGPNILALEIIEATVNIPKGVSTHPKRGSIPHKSDGSHYREWLTILGAGNGQDLSGARKVLLFDELGILDVSGVSGSSLQITVDEISIACRAKLGPGDVIEAITTDISINSGSSDPAMPFSCDPVPTGGAKLMIGPKGELTALGLTYSDTTGYREQDLGVTAAGIEPFLKGVHQTVKDTAAFYQQISQI